MQSIHGPFAPSREVVAAVDKELKKLSSQEPLLPWPSVSSSSTVGSGSRKQKKSKQQQKGSVRKRR